MEGRREGGREGSREGGREGGKEDGREGGKKEEGGREARIKHKHARCKGANHTTLPANETSLTVLRKIYEFLV